MKKTATKPSILRPLSRRNFIRLSAFASSAAVVGMPNLLRAGANDKLNVAFIGLGGQGRARLKEMIDGSVNAVNVVAFCDVDERQFNEAKKTADPFPFDPKLYTDYRKLLDSEKNLDAVVVATPDHWHTPIVKAVLQHRKHLFCEKPLTHTISEAREVRTLAKKSKVVTQMGNQGSASNQMRRAIELIQGGAIGKVREIHSWVFGAGCHPGLALPTTGDPVPDGLHWDEWIGPAPFRPYKTDYYHPWNWRGWFDFGNGVVADFGCHNLNLAFRALKLDYPVRIETDAELTGLPTYPARARIRFDFAARGDLPPLTIWWHDGGRMPPDGVIPPSVIEHLGETPKSGVLTLGENGFTFGDPWKCAEYIKLNNETKISGILQHAATRSIPETLPRSPGHLKEWVNACTGGGPVFSDFETGGHLTEIALSGVVALRTGKTLEWDGPGMRAKNAPEADKYIKASYRKGWSA